MRIRNPERINHGSSGYSHANCRCEICKAAKAQDNQRARDRKKLKEARPTTTQSLQPDYSP